MFLFCDKTAAFSLFEEIVSIAQAVFFRLHKYGFSKSVRQTMLLMPGSGNQTSQKKHIAICWNVQTQDDYKTLAPAPTNPMGEPCGTL